MATLRGNFSQLLAPGILHMMFEELMDPQHPEEYSQFLDVTTSERAYEDDQIIAGFGQSRLKHEGDEITFDDPRQGGTKRYVPDTFALAWQVTKEMWDDDQYGVMRRMPGELIRGMREGWEQVAANVFNNSGSTITTADGVSLLNTAHPLQDGAGTTIANRLNPDAELSRTAVQDILILFENMVNPRNLKMRVSPTDIWIPADLQFTYAQIFQSQFEPGTANNDINPIQGRLQGHVLHYLTDTNNWFVTARSHNTMRFVWRQRPVTDSFDDFKTKSAQYSIDCRYTAGATDWRGVAGSLP